MTVSVGGTGIQVPDFITEAIGENEQRKHEFQVLVGRIMLAQSKRFISKYELYKQCMATGRIRRFLYDILFFWKKV